MSTRLLATFANYEYFSEDCENPLVMCQEGIEYPVDRYQGYLLTTSRDIAKMFAPVTHKGAALWLILYPSRTRMAHRNLMNSPFNIYQQFK